jgi:hypothetical protein
VKSKGIKGAEQEAMKAYRKATKDCLEKRKANTGEIGSS